MVRALYEFGCRLSERVANAAGHPSAQLIVILFCIGWLAVGRTQNALTLVLSVAAITLTQMVLNTQRRHDAALHAKMDELIHGVKGARNELAGIEGKSEADIIALKERLAEPENQRVA